MLGDRSLSSSGCSCHDLSNRRPVSHLSSLCPLFLSEIMSGTVWFFERQKRQRNARRVPVSTVLTLVVALLIWDVCVVGPVPASTTIFDPHGSGESSPFFPHGHRVANLFLAKNIQVYARDRLPTPTLLSFRRRTSTPLSAVVMVSKITSSPYLR